MSFSLGTSTNTCVFPCLILLHLDGAKHPSLLQGPGLLAAPHSSPCAQVAATPHPGLGASQLVSETTPTAVSHQWLHRSQKRGMQHHM